MTREDNENLYQEYQAMRQSEYIHRHAKLDNNDNEPETVHKPLTEHESAQLAVARANCKTRKEWQDDEANDIRLLSIGAMVHRSASERLDKSNEKTYRAQLTEEEYERRIAECEAKIAAAEHDVATRKDPRRKRQYARPENKLKHWKDRLYDLQQKLAEHRYKQFRHERLYMKWLGVMDKINSAEIAKQIGEEKRGIGNKYGFNPKAKSRATAEIVFQD